MSEEVKSISTSNNPNKSNVNKNNSKKQKNKQKQKQKQKANKNVQLSAASLELTEPCPMVDIGANLLDTMFQGVYHGSTKHSPDLPVVLKRAKQAHVQHIIITAGSLEEGLAALTLAESDPGFLKSTVGVHPTRCDLFEQVTDIENEEGSQNKRTEGSESVSERYLNQLIDLAVDGKNRGLVVAIGECGLDYARTQFCAKETQLTYFKQHFKLTEATGLPMFLHCRDAQDDMLAILTHNRSRFSGGVVHSFDGTYEEAKSFLDLGLYIGLNGCSLRTPESIEVVKKLPSDRILIETDAPWCEIRPSHPGYSYINSKWPTVKNSKYNPDNPDNQDEKELHEVSEEKAADSRDSLVSPICVKSRYEPCHLLQVLEVIAAVRGVDKYVLAREVRDNTSNLFRV